MMDVKLLAAEWSSLQIQVEFTHKPTAEDEQYLQQLFDSWYTLGLLGGFNANFTPLQDAEVDDLSELDYPDPKEALPSLMHNMGEVTFEHTWARCWFDLGTADPLALDILLNALRTLGRDYVSIRQVVIGGSEDL